MNADDRSTDRRREESSCCGGSGAVAVPQQIRDSDLIRVCSPDCDSHETCGNPGKRPVYSVDDAKSLSTIESWVESGGNAGVVTNDDLLVLDVDTDEFADLVDDCLPATFTVLSGTGEHRYYRSEWSENRKFGPLGSIRANNWQVVIPPSTHPSGSRYRVSHDRPIADADESSIRRLIDRTADRSADRSADRQHAGGGCVGGSGDGGDGANNPRSIPPRYPSKPGNWPGLKEWLLYNGLLDIISQTSSDDWSGDEFAAAKCLAEGGFSADSIHRVLDRTSHRSKWHRRDDKYRSDTVENAIIAACEDDFVDFTAYKPDSGERRKTEDGESDGTASETPEKGGENVMSAEYSDHEEVHIIEADDVGEDFRKVTRTTRTDDETGETVEFVSLKKGRLAEMDTPDGDSVVVESINSSSSLGSVDYIDELAAALTELDERLNGSD